jgi:hypothetical protein
METEVVPSADSSLDSWVDVCEGLIHPTYRVGVTETDSSSRLHGWFATIISGAGTRFAKSIGALAKSRQRMALT